MELYTSIWGLLNTHPLSWIALQPRSLSAHLYVSLALHSSFRLCHHRRRRRAWQLSLALISRHRLSVTLLILVSPFKPCSSLKHRYHAAWSCGWLSAWLLHTQPDGFTLTSMKVFCNLDKIIHLTTSLSQSSLRLERSWGSKVRVLIKENIKCELKCFFHLRGVLNKAIHRRF